jgi:hypothetical protein
LTTWTLLLVLAITGIESSSEDFFVNPVCDMA